MNDRAWMDDALCAEVGPLDDFFPKPSSQDGAGGQYAKKICAACDVRRQCLEYAIKHDIQEGIWGGMSIRGRRALKKAA